MPRSPFKQKDSFESKPTNISLKIPSPGNLNFKRAVVLPGLRRRDQAEIQNPSTPREGPSYLSTSWEHSLDPTSTRPSLSQIAMGLHLSHTPYGRRHSSSPPDDVPSPKSKLPPPAPLSRPTHHRRSSAPPPSTPTRSAMKKPPSLSVTTPSLTSTSSSGSSHALSTPTSPPSLLSLKQRVARYIPRSPRVPSAPTSGSGSASLNSVPTSSKKSVRFRDQ